MGYPIQTDLEEEFASYYTTTGCFVKIIVNMYIACQQGVVESNGCSVIVCDVKFSTNASKTSLFFTDVTYIDFLANHFIPTIFTNTST